MRIFEDFYFQSRKKDVAEILVDQRVDEEFENVTEKRKTVILWALLWTIFSNTDRPNDGDTDPDRSIGCKSDQIHPLTRPKNDFL